MELIFRRINPDEERLLDFLIEKSEMNLPLPENWKEHLWVAPLDHMGGLRLCVEPDDRAYHGPDVSVSSCRFDDVDGVPVYAMLFLRKDNDHLYELDLWKVTDEPLLKIADSFRDDDSVKM